MTTSASDVALPTGNPDTSFLRIQPSSLSKLYEFIGQSVIAGIAVGVCSGVAALLLGSDVAYIILFAGVGLAIYGSTNHWFHGGFQIERTYTDSNSVTTRLPSERGAVFEIEIAGQNSIVNKRGAALKPLVGAEGK